MLSIRSFITNCTKKTVRNGFLRYSSQESASEATKLQEASLNEKLFLVDSEDKVVGHATKRDCHLVKKGLPLHRAFSVFLFNDHGDLLLQKRAVEKVTFPDVYTNSCCSHPTLDYPGEDEECDALGVKRAAQRRLQFELGIAPSAIPLEKLHYLTRIQYKDEGDGQWGEHEVDYILFFKGNVKIRPNPNEISEITFIPRKELTQHIPTLGPLTPWFELILKHRLRFWWDNLDKLDEITDHEKIHYLKH